MLKLKRQGHRLLVTPYNSFNKVHRKKRKLFFGKRREEELQSGQKAMKKNLSIPKTSHAG
jgi:hypothetical protein